MNIKELSNLVDTFNVAERSGSASLETYRMQIKVIVDTISDDDLSNKWLRSMNVNGSEIVSRALTIVNRKWK